MCKSCTDNKWLHYNDENVESINNPVEYFTTANRFPKILFFQLKTGKLKPSNVKVFF